MDDSSQPQVVVDSNGNSTAIWVENGVVRASFLPLNGTWSTPAVLSGSGASSLRLGVDGSGDVTAVWLSSNGTVQSATLPLNGSWSAATAISASGSETPSLAVNASGTVAIVWANNGFIQTRTKILGILSLVSTISPSNSSNPDVAISTNGKVVAVWRTLLGSGADMIQSATQTNGTWASAVNVIPFQSAYNHNNPAISIDANGNADVLWFRYLVTNGVYSNLFLYSAYLPSTSTSWSQPIQISDTGAVNPSSLFLDIRADSFGNKIAIWSISLDGGTFIVESSFKTPGGAWGPFSILQDSNLYSLSGGLDCDALGNAVSVNMVFDGSSVKIQAAEASTWELVAQLFWGSQRILSSNPNNGFPVVAANFEAASKTSFVTALWLTSNGTNTILQAATASKQSISPPSNLMVTQSVQNYGVFQDYYNTITWSASPSPNVFEYVVYRNGVLISQVNSSTFQFVDHHAVQNGSVTYSVAAVDGNLFPSQIINVNFP